MYDTERTISFRNALNVFSWNRRKVTFQTNLQKLIYWDRADADVIRSIYTVNFEIKRGIQETVLKENMSERI